MSAIYIDARLDGATKANIEFLELNKTASLICSSEATREKLRAQYPQMAERFILWNEKKQREAISESDF